MTTPPIRVCPITGQELPPDRYAAPAAAGQLIADLADLPDLANELETTLTRQVRMPQVGGGSPQDERLPYNPAAAEAAYILRTTILSIADDIANDRNDPTPDTWRDVARYLQHHADQLTRTERGTEQIEELTTAIRLARRTIDRPADRQYAGPCPNCQTDLTAPHGAEVAQCHGCDDTISIQDQVEWMNSELLSMVLPATQARHAARIITRTEVTDANLRVWVARGKIAPRPHYRHERAFHVGELVTLAEAKAARMSA